jgi:nicotinamide mononucleotide transporter
VLWYRKDEKQQHVLHITGSTKKEWEQQVLFFLAFYVVIFLCLSYLKQQFAPGALPAADAFASSTAFTGMWLMAKKKVESWYWWICTNIASIPLYYVKGYAFTSIYYTVLLILAISGLIEWKKRARTLA